MSILVFLHHPNERPCLLGQMLQACGHQLQPIHLYAGQPVPADLNAPGDVDGIISMGGPMNVGDVAEHPWITAELAYLKRAHEAGVPIVGVCLGAQLIAAALGGQVAAMPNPPGGPGPEIGFAPIRTSFFGSTDPILAGLPWSSPMFHLHGQEVTKLPAEGVVLAGSKACKTQAFRVGLFTYAFQFHFEWNRQTLEVVARDPWVTTSGGPAMTQAIMDGCAAHYAAYRRLGDRLCDNLATLLFPLDKR